MNEPTPWREEDVDPALLEALDSVAADRMPEAVRAKLRAGLPEGPPGDGGGVASGPAGGGALGAAGAVGLLAAAALLGFWAFRPAPPPTDTSAASRERSLTPEEAASPRATSSSSDRATLGVAEPRAPRSEPAEPPRSRTEPTDPTVPALRPVASEPAAGPSSAREGGGDGSGGDERALPPRERPREIDLLDRAQARLEASPRRALALVRRHARLYPEGVLRPEREVLRVEALARLGRRDAAAAAARTFLAAHPGAAHRARVELLLGELESE